MQKTLGALAAVVLASGLARRRGRDDEPRFGRDHRRGSVFVSNPVQSLGDESLTDQEDADAPCRRRRTTTSRSRISTAAGSCTATTPPSQRDGQPRVSPTNTFRYTRHQDEFEQVMAYYWITEAQKYIQSLGFGVTRRAIDDRPQPVRINQWGHDNSFATDHPTNELRFGKGGVDDAEDAEVILHEYGHAIHFSQNFSFASEEAGAISEGFGDYWAVTVSDVVAGRSASRTVSRWRASPTGTPPPTRARCRTACVGSTRPALPGRPERRGPPRRPDLVARAVGHPAALGNVKADTIILQGSFDFPGTTMPDLANRTVAAAQQLYGTRGEGRPQAFADRGIL